MTRHPFILLCLACLLLTGCLVVKIPPPVVVPVIPNSVATADDSAAWPVSLASPALEAASDQTNRFIVVGTNAAGCRLRWDTVRNITNVICPPTLPTNAVISISPPTAGTLQWTTNFKTWATVCQVSNQPTVTQPLASAPRRFYRLLVTAVTNGTASVNVAWNRNPDLTVTGYNLYWGSASLNYTNHVDAGPATNAIIAGLLQGRTYHFAANDYTAAGVPSLFSSDLAYRIPTNAPARPMLAIITQS